MNIENCTHRSFKNITFVLCWTNERSDQKDTVLDIDIHPEFRDVKMFKQARFHFANFAL
jgi:hypothetical protein